MFFAVIAMACNLLSTTSEPLTQEELSATIEALQSELAETRQNIPEVPLQQPPAEPRVAQEEVSLVELYARVNPSVVNITTFREIQGEIVSSGQGSGFVFDTDGHIVTNAHVVHGSEQIDVAFADGTTLPAENIGEDLHSDLAVLEVASVPEGITPLELGNMEAVVVGQTVIAIGNPFGLGGTLTEGIISALGRTIPGLTTFSIPEAIQTDAAINPGNSGGPLLDLNGKVIGVNAQIQTDGLTRSNQGVGFAIPVSTVQRVVPELIRDGAYEWSWVGVIGQDLNPEIAEAMDLPTQKGAYLLRIVEGGPAERANLQGATDDRIIRGRETPVGGDVIIAIDGQPVESFDDLLIYISSQPPGQEVILTILRDGETRDITLTLGERPESVDTLFPE
jgi:2-alkenal reductase